MRRPAKVIAEFFGVTGAVHSDNRRAGRGFYGLRDPGYRGRVGQNEIAHVQLIRSTLTAMGAQPIAKPAINLNALGFGFGSQAEFLTLSRALEDVGVTAYNGAMPLMQSNAVMALAARILGTEAQHAGNIRTQIGQRGLRQPRSTA